MDPCRLERVQRHWTVLLSLEHLPPRHPEGALASRGIPSTEPATPAQWVLERSRRRTDQVSVTGSLLAPLGRDDVWVVVLTCSQSSDHAQEGAAHPA